ncbi:MAG: hypothetical protein VKP62_13510 [Candidatus Sericytochromatia bacterium]|nr:hypothetical protein [Candidatus Sericytochromatia bacterium]
MPAPSSRVLTLLLTLGCVAVAVCGQPELAHGQVRVVGFAPPAQWFAWSASPHPIPPDVVAAEARRLAWGGDPPTPAAVITVSPEDRLLEGLDRLLVGAHKLERSLEARDWLRAEQVHQEFGLRLSGLRQQIDDRYARTLTPAELRHALLGGLVAAKHPSALKEAKNLVEDLNMGAVMASRILQQERSPASKPARPAAPKVQGSAAPRLSPALNAALDRFAARLNPATPGPRPRASTRPVAAPGPSPTPYTPPLPSPPALPPVSTPRPTPVPTPVPTPRPTPIPTPVPTPRPTPVSTPVPTPVPTPRPTPVPPPTTTSAPTPEASDQPAEAPSTLPALTANTLSVPEYLNKAYISASTVYTYLRLGQTEVAQAELGFLRAYLQAATPAATLAQRRTLADLDRLAARLQQQLRSGDQAAFASSRALTEKFLQLDR